MSGFLEESAGTLDFTNLMFNAQSKQLSCQGRHGCFKRIEVNRKKGCKKRKQTHTYTYTHTLTQTDTHRHTQTHTDTQTHTSMPTDAHTDFLGG